MAKPWERLPGETDKQWAAFCVYRDLKNIADPTSSRSIERAGEVLGKSSRTLEPWSSKNRWVERAEAWDTDQERIVRELAQKEMQEEIRRMLKRQAEAGKFAQVKAIKALNKIPDEDIKPSDVARLLEAGSKLERIGRGYAGDVIEERESAEAAPPPVTFYMPDNGRDNKEDDDTEE